MENHNPTDVKPITEGQIGKLNQNMSAVLRKHRNEIPSDLFQLVLRDKTLLDNFYALVQRRINATSNMITRTVKVDRTRSAQDALNATGREQYVHDEIAKAMPQGKGKEIKVIFFTLDFRINIIDDKDLDKEYQLRGLKPVDPYSLIAVNEVEPAFANTYPNTTHWKNEKDNWCHIRFLNFHVGLSDISLGFSSYFWFAGVPI